MKRAMRCSWLWLVIMGCGGEEGWTHPDAILGNDDGVQVEEVQMRMAPLSRQFVDYLAAPRGTQRMVSHLGLGRVPEPIDFSHLGLSPTVQQRAALPASYDLRSLGRVTDVRNQLDCGTCWSFSAYGSLESSLRGASETWDFSENHLKNAHGFDLGPCDGGHALMAAAYLTRGTGPVTEAADPYKPNDGASPQGLTAQKRIREVLFLASRTGAADNARTKQAVMEHGGVYVDVYWDATRYSASTASLYVSSWAIPNHAVVIVGWDDNWSAQKFSPQAPGAGAFLARNSWGTSFGLGGYFYISYHDAVLGRESPSAQDASATLRVFADAVTPGPYQRVYQYDPYGLVDSLGAGSETAWYANVFAASARGALAEVSTYSMANGAEYEISVYDSVVSSPITSTLLGRLSGTFPLAGYHTVSMRSAGIMLTQGRKFSIVVKLRTPSYLYPIPIEFKSVGYASLATASPGQSYISVNGSTFYDLTNPHYVPGCSTCNVCVKAVVDESCDDGNPCTIESGDPGSCLHTPAANTTVCRPSAGPCDLAETCRSGVCPADSLASSTTTCRAAAGECDAAELCSGDSAECPSEAWRVDGSSCAAGEGKCQQGACESGGTKIKGDVDVASGSDSIDGGSSCASAGPGNNTPGPVLLLLVTLLVRRRRSRSVCAASA